MVFKSFRFSKHTIVIIFILTYIVLSLIYYLTYYHSHFYERFEKNEIETTDDSESNEPIKNNKFNGTDSRNYQLLKKLNVSFVTDPNNSTNIIQCPQVPPGLVGRVEADLYSYTIEEIEKEYSNLGHGGHWWPKHCTSNHRVAIIVPYRNRFVQFRIFLYFMHSFLQKQLLDYQIFLVEPHKSITFNRALLFNIGFTEALKDYGWECFIFHDVDLIPQDDRNFYYCPVEPRHMSVAVNTMNYQLPYRTIFGGVSAMTREQFRSLNGFSNVFFGWGGEDDNMASRIMQKYRISRYPLIIGRYKMLRHYKDKPNQNRCCAA
ncbi:unnamed protein product [Didymodactylos carnosus]|uniref:Beta-1,4-galactosyltransferase n=1 Tax=Didymodactylos carnosus TaxID=1234261 RepID=A0A8S2CWE9_9BILA|nr:unnamed protein product [Didymodactylos carnosus]CAF3605052.1 unnamed protein product [Didymodactylos carnosus]